MFLLMHYLTGSFSISHLWTCIVNTPVCVDSCPLIVVAKAQLSKLLSCHRFSHFPNEQVHDQKLQTSVQNYPGCVTQIINCNIIVYIAVLLARRNYNYVQQNLSHQFEKQNYTVWCTLTCTKYRTLAKCLSKLANFEWINKPHYTVDGL